MSDASSEMRSELAAIVRGFADRLRWEQRCGAAWVGAAPCPRIGAAQAVPVDAPAAVAVAPEIVAPVAPGPGPGAANPAARLAALRAELGDCQRCGLSAARRQIVFGCGSPTAELMLVGEAPGREEDEQGEPFVGAAGQLLTRMIRAMGLAREDVYIANIIKCRPPRNRDPEPEEIGTCEPFLVRQIEIIAPRVIIALGNVAAKALLRTQTGITRLRGTWHQYHGVPVMPTFHPAYLLRNAEGKRPVWSDLQQVMAQMDRLGLKRGPGAR
jgi:DNA polymerase